MERLAGRIILLWGWRRLLAAFAAGAFAVLAQAPYDFIAAGFVCFPVLVWLLDGTSATGPGIHEVTYNALAPGSYKFTVKAENQGIYSKETTYAFTIASPIYTRWWFIVSGATLLLGAVALVYRRQIAAQQKKARVQNELNALKLTAIQSQMNPHFIFNCMNSIKSLIQEDEKSKAVVYLTTFSKLIRTVFHNSDKREITLFDEIETCRLYTQLESMRFENKFNYEYNIDETVDLRSIQVPALIIQPFIENAIWHGLMHKEEKGHLQVQIFREDEMLCCKITDDGIGRKKAEVLNHHSTSIHKSMGLRITEERIAMLQQQKQIKSSVQITDLVLPDGTAGGTEVLLKMPLIL